MAEHLPRDLLAGGVVVEDDLAGDLSISAELWPPIGAQF